MTGVVVVRKPSVLVVKRNGKVIATGVTLVQNITTGSSAGGSSYVHTQAIAALNWTVAHNLARRPSATVVDHLGNTIEPDIRYLDDNTILITHGTPLTGAVYCN